MVVVVAAEDEEEEADKAEEVQISQRTSVESTVGEEQQRRVCACLRE